MSNETQNETSVTSEDNRLVAERRAKLAAIREQGNAFPNTFRRDAYAADLQEQFGELEKAELEEKNHVVSIAGRIVRNRGAFMLLQDMTGQIQAYVNRKALDPEVLKDIKTWDLGDIIGVTGPVHKSGKGDLYVDMQSVELLTKSLRPLPDKHHGLADMEMRYRQRYVDLIVNQESRKTFEVRSKIISTIRRFLEDRRFMEVETPMLQTIPGGASARPFVTHHNAMDMEMFLRIAPELYLKRLVVGGFERVFEINRNFRNEGVSTRHNPEFTMIEFYQAYADYKDLMDLTEEMLRTVSEQVMGSTKVPYQGEEFDFGAPFVRMTMLEAILHYNPELTEADLATVESATAIAKKLHIDVQPIWGLGKLWTEIFEETAESKLIQPTFITEYPAEVSPLARRNDHNEFITDRFEFFIGGREIANGFSELNDSEDQAERFRRQVEEKDAGDDEAMHYDADYINALEYGLPPTAGQGIGIDRLVMLFTDAASIRDVLLFPHMRPQD
ncbi:Lysine--tRNA ligase, heat inducible [Marinomonas aquimarina]|uniref:Lysine--tRNA ligase n=1 Tax=Marinomonas aquimarina TaxID=295068 RepID=A0A1A8TG92_9GAMM|nr:lysine--tRNA ligase [Marinomonas aquimarina]SBS32468.1 Lysine--tRNA ligase, heat inducible [Marinomonas aquimarina]